MKTSKTRERRRQVQWPHGYSHNTTLTPPTVPDTRTRGTCKHKTAFRRSACTLVPCALGSGGVGWMCSRFFFLPNAFLPSFPSTLFHHPPTPYHLYHQTLGLLIHLPIRSHLLSSLHFHLSLLLNTHPSSIPLLKHYSCLVLLFDYITLELD